MNIFNRGRHESRNLHGYVFSARTNLPRNLSPLSDAVRVQLVRVVAKRHAHQYLLSLFRLPNLTPSSHSVTLFLPSLLPSLSFWSSPSRSIQHTPFSSFRPSSCTLVTVRVSSPLHGQTKSWNRLTVLRQRGVATPPHTIVTTRVDCERLMSRVRPRRAFAFRRISISKYYAFVGLPLSSICTVTCTKSGPSNLTFSSGKGSILNDHDNMHSYRLVDPE